LNSREKLFGTIKEDLGLQTTVDMWGEKALNHHEPAFLRRSFIPNPTGPGVIAKFDSERVLNKWLTPHVIVRTPQDSFDRSLGYLMLSGGDQQLFDTIHNYMDHLKSTEDIRVPSLYTNMDRNNLIINYYRPHGKIDPRAREYVDYETFTHVSHQGGFPLAIAIPSGEGKTTLKAKHPKLFADHDDFIMGKNKVTQTKLIDEAKSTGDWTKVNAFNRSVVPKNLNKVLLTWSPSTTPDGFLFSGAFMLDKATAERENLANRSHLANRKRLDTYFYPNFHSRDQDILAMVPDTLFHRRHNPFVATNKFYLDPTLPRSEERKFKVLPQHPELPENRLRAYGMGPLNSRSRRRSHRSNANIIAEILKHDPPTINRFDEFRTFGDIIRTVESGAEPASYVIADVLKSKLRIPYSQAEIILNKLDAPQVIRKTSPYYRTFLEQVLEVVKPDPKTDLTRHGDVEKNPGPIYGSIHRLLKKEFQAHTRLFNPYHSVPSSNSHSSNSRKSRQNTGCNRPRRRPRNRNTIDPTDIITNSRTLKETRLLQSHLFETDPNGNYVWKVGPPPPMVVIHSWTSLPRRVKSWIFNKKITIEDITKKIFQRPKIEFVSSVESVNIVHAGLSTPHKPRPFKADFHAVPCMSHLAEPDLLDWHPGYVNICFSCGHTTTSQVCPRCDLYTWVGLGSKPGPSNLVVPASKVWLRGQSCKICRDDFLQFLFRPPIATLHSPVIVQDRYINNTNLILKVLPSLTPHKCDVRYGTYRTCFDLYVAAYRTDIRSFYVRESNVLLRIGEWDKDSLPMRHHFKVMGQFTQHTFTGKEPNPPWPMGSIKVLKINELTNPTTVCYCLRSISRCPAHQPLIDDLESRLSSFTAYDSHSITVLSSSQTLAISANRQSSWPHYDKYGLNNENFSMHGYLERTIVGENLDRSKVPGEFSCRDCEKSVWQPHGRHFVTDLPSQSPESPTLSSNSKYDIAFTTKCDSRSCPPIDFLRPATDIPTSQLADN
jgi:hypothetical protein